MNSASSTGTSSKKWRRLFIGILILQLLLEIGVGAALLFDLPTALESGFGITYTSEIDILGVALGLYLFLLSTLIILSIVWTNSGNPAGITMGITIGVFLVIFGVVTFFKYGEINGILVDSIRGLLTIIFAYLTGKELKL